LVSCLKERKYMEGFWEQGAKENVLTYDRGSRRFEKVVWGASLFIHCCKFVLSDQGQSEKCLQSKGKRPLMSSGYRG